MMMWLLGLGGRVYDIVINEEDVKHRGGIENDA